MLRGLWESLARDAWFSVLGPLATGKKDLCRVLSCRHCESRLEPGTRKQPLLTLFVYKVKGPWKGGERVQVLEVSLHKTWSPKRNRKQSPPACSCCPIHKDDLSVTLLWQGFSASGIFLEFGLMHLLLKAAALNCFLGHWRFEGKMCTILPRTGQKS